jgi:hypothetical protein
VDAPSGDREYGRVRSTRLRSTSPQRAALDLLGMLLATAVLLYAPFVYAAHRLSLARRLPDARVSEIAHSTCRELRDTPLDESWLEAFVGGPAAHRAGQEQQLIERRSQQLNCRPPIDARWAH